jgi:hypothetical protein
MFQAPEPSSAAAAGLQQQALYLQLGAGSMYACANCCNQMLCACGELTVTTCQTKAHWHAAYGRGVLPCCCALLATASAGVDQPNRHAAARKQ